MYTKLFFYWSFLCTSSQHLLYMLSILIILYSSCIFHYSLSISWVTSYWILFFKKYWKHYNSLIIHFYAPSFTTSNTEHYALVSVMQFQYCLVVLVLVCCFITISLFWYCYLILLLSSCSSTMYWVLYQNFMLILIWNEIPIVLLFLGHVTYYTWVLFYVELWFLVTFMSLYHDSKVYLFLLIYISIKYSMTHYYSRDFIKRCTILLSRSFLF